VLQGQAALAGLCIPDGGQLICPLRLVFARIINDVEIMKVHTYRLRNPGSDHPSDANSVQCPVIPPFEQTGWIVTVVLAVLYPVLICTMAVHFIANKNLSIVMKKRSTLLMLVSCLGAMALYMAAIFPLLVPSMPCWLRAGFDHSTSQVLEN
jgi:hypothetical protein